MRTAANSKAMTKCNVIVSSIDCKPPNVRSPRPGSKRRTPIKSVRRSTPPELSCASDRRRDEEKEVKQTGRIDEEKQVGSK